MAQPKSWNPGLIGKLLQELKKTLRKYKQKYKLFVGK